MVRAFVLYESEPDPERYEQHAELCRQVPGRRRSGTGRSSARRWASRRTRTTPSGSSRTATRSRRPRAARSSWRPARTRWRWAAASTSSSRTSREPSPTRPAPLAPDELGFERIVYEKAPPRATITLNRPEVLNAFDFQMLRELARACEDASWDDEIRVVVVTGAGRAFCVGADLQGVGATSYVGKPNEYWKWFGAFKDMHDRLREIGKPTLARINGIAVGGGNELQMACDLAVMVDDAFIRHVGPEHGSVPAGGATQWLTIMVGDRRAREIVLLCEEIPATQGRGVGARQLGRARRRSSTRRSTRSSRTSRASCRRRRATRSSS